MNPAAEEKPAWDRRRLGIVILAIFLVQLALVWGLSDRRSPTVRPPPELPTQRLISAQALDAHFAWDVFDTAPALFALADARGFSGAAWLKFAPPARGESTWQEPPAWLSLPENALGAELRRQAAEVAPARMALNEKPDPATADLRVPTPALQNASTLRVEGRLAARRLRDAPTLPAWTAADLLADSVVQISADADGDVVTATLLSVRGLKGAEQKAADERALELARGLRFEPLARAEPGLTLGDVVFRWQTLPPPDTNPPAVKGTP